MRNCRNLLLHLPLAPIFYSPSPRFLLPSSGMTAQTDGRGCSQREVKLSALVDAVGRAWRAEDLYLRKHSLTGKAHRWDHGIVFTSKKGMYRAFYSLEAYRRGVDGWRGSSWHQSTPQSTSSENLASCGDVIPGNARFYEKVMRLQREFRSISTAKFTNRKTGAVTYSYRMGKVSWHF